MEATDSKTSCIRWAKELLRHSDWVILDSHSAGSGKKAVIIQIGVLSPGGEVLIDTLVRPPRKHRLQDGDLKPLEIDKHVLSEAPKFASLVPELQAVFEGKRVLSFDITRQKKLFHQTAERHGCVPLKIKWADAVGVRYQKFLGVSRTEAGSLELPREGTSVGAIGACQAVLKLLKKIGSERIPKTKVKEHGPKAEGTRNTLLRLLILLVLVGAAMFLLLEFPSLFQR